MRSRRVSARGRLEPAADARPPHLGAGAQMHAWFLTSSRDGLAGLGLPQTAKSVSRQNTGDRR